MSDRLQELEVFVRTAETGSFSKTASDLGLSQPSVSRIIGQLEARLGAALLLRTTRRITVTDAGAQFLEHAREILAAVEAAEDAARGIDSLRGTIRVAMPIIYGTQQVIPRLATFMAAHPLLRVEMTVADERQNLVAEGADVAIRIGDLDSSTFGARKLTTLDRFPVAAPAYLAARGAPRSPADLAAHDCIFGPGGFGRDRWSFTRNGSVTTVGVQGRVHTDSGPGVFASVLAGLGISLASSVMCAAEIKAGSLVPLLTEYQMARVDVHAVFPGGPRPSGKVRAFVDYLAAAIRAA